MEVILLERIEKLGQMGDVVTVRPGYARNCLLPKKKAMRATEENRTSFESQRAQLEAANLERRSEAEHVGKRMRGLHVGMIRQAGEGGHLYGSVNARDVADAVTEAGVTVRRQQVMLDHPIKDLGLHAVRIALHPEVFEEVFVNVARSEEEAALQAAGQTVGAPDEAEADEAEPEKEAIEVAEVFEAEALEEFEAVRAEAEAEAEAKPAAESEAEAQTAAEAKPADEAESGTEAEDAPKAQAMPEGEAGETQDAEGAAEAESKD